MAESTCPVPSEFKGIYFISKKFEKFENREIDKKIDFSKILNLNSDENKEKIKQARKSMNRPHFALNYKNNNVNKIENNKKSLKNLQKKTIYGLVDFCKIKLLNQRFIRRNFL